MTVKTIAEMTTEIRECNIAHGWRDDATTWGEYLALLHTEIAEITGAYRKHRLADATTTIVNSDGTGTEKPQGVGSELADTLIRLLDMYDVREIPVYDGGVFLTDITPWTFGQIEGTSAERDFEDTFGDWCAWLHRQADRLWDNPTWCAPLFLTSLVTFAARWEINLDAEMARKIAYNWTRGYQHGGTISDSSFQGGAAGLPAAGLPPA